MNTGKTHAIVEKTRTLKTCCLAMLVAVVVLGGVGVDGGWGQAGNFSWSHSGNAVAGNEGKFNGETLFDATSSSEQGSSSQSCKNQSDCKRLTCPDGKIQACNKGTCSCSSNESQPEAPPTSPDNGSGPAAEGPSSPPPTKSSNDGNESPAVPVNSDLRQCGPGGCGGGDNDKDPPPGLPLCSDNLLQCCKNDQEKPPFCFNIRLGCKCPDLT